MRDDLFNELLQSVREGGAILRGEARPSRSFVIADPDVSAIRQTFNLSQPKFAAFLGISTRTLQNWEQKRRKPEGPAKVLLQVAAKHPEAILDVVSETPTDRTVKVGRMTKAKRAGSAQTRVAPHKRASAKKIAVKSEKKGIRSAKR